MPASKKPAKATATTRLQTAKMRAAAAHVTPAESARLDRIARAHAARMAAEFKDLLDVAQGLERVEPSLGGAKGRLPRARDLASKTGRAGLTMPHADLLGRLPRNSDGAPVGNASPSERGGARGDSQAFLPSGNLAAYMKGATSGDATVTKDATTGTVEKTWTQRNSDGSTTMFQTAYNQRDGTSTSTQTTRAGGGEVLRIQVTDRRDGSSEGETRVTDPAGRTVSHLWARDASGRMVTDYFQTTDSSGRLVEEWDRAADRRGGLVRLPSDDAGSDLGRRLGARFSHGASKPAPTVTQVNPGDRDDSGSRAPKINLGKQIVVNPRVESGHQAREMSAARARHAVRQVREKIGGHVNPPGPSRRKN